jgi:hypothetical protein
MLVNILFPVFDRSIVYRICAESDAICTRDACAAVPLMCEVGGTVRYNYEQGVRAIDTVPICIVYTVRYYHYTGTSNTVRYCTVDTSVK